MVDIEHRRHPTQTSPTTLSRRTTSARMLAPHTSRTQLWEAVRSLDLAFCTRRVRCPSHQGHHPRRLDLVRLSMRCSTRRGGRSRCKDRLSQRGAPASPVATARWVQRLLMPPRGAPPLSAQWHHLVPLSPVAPPLSYFPPALPPIRPCHLPGHPLRPLPLPRSKSRLPLLLSSHQLRKVSRLLQHPTTTDAPTSRLCGRLTARSRLSLGNTNTSPLERMSSVGPIEARAYREEPSMHRKRGGDESTCWEGQRKSQRCRQRRPYPTSRQWTTGRAAIIPIIFEEKTESPLLFTLYH